MKGNKMDLIVEKATELGVKAITPFASMFTMAHPGKERDEDRQRRWSRIAMSAAKQCGRARIPEISPTLLFRDVVSQRSGEELRLIFWEREKQTTLRELARSGDRPTALRLVVGSEGGFSEEEVSHACAQGFVSVGLGPRTLRGETAAVVVLALAQHLWGDLS
jgi:16S rRNA (uracil1498-N3)-methyltransferase